MEKKMIKITKENPICICGHYKREHSSWETSCYKSLRRKERKKNPKTNKYEVFDCNFQCTCRKFEEKK
jgi:hypothetical protein